jgi:hypothetical protein
MATSSDCPHSSGWSVALLSDDPVISVRDMLFRVFSISCFRDCEVGSFSFDVSLRFSKFIRGSGG